MQPNKTIVGWKKALWEGAALIVIFLVAVLALYGQKTLPDSSLPFGFYTATTNDAGVAFYQKQDHASYLVSPFNDYLITNGTRRAILEIPSGSPARITRPRNVFPDRLVTGVVSYLGSGQLSYTLGYHDLLTEYVGEVTDDTLRITRTITVPSGSALPEQVGMTLLLSRDDVVSDARGILMTESSDAAQALMATVTGQTIIRPELEQRKRESRGNTLVILNPHTRGILTVQVPTAHTVIVDNETKLIEFVETTPDSMKDQFMTTMTIQTTL